MVSPVIDLSHHNPEPDWKALKHGGVIAVMMKATEGTSYVDPTWASRALKAQDAGLLIAPYHFFKGGNVTKQMDWFLSQSAAPQGGRIVIDHETDATLDELCQAVTYVRGKRPDLQLTVYSGHTIKEQLGSTGVRNELIGTSLWIAQYTSASAPSWPKQQWPQWSLWQWTDKETVPGISQPVDGNKWNGSPENLVRWMSPTGSQPAPAPEPSVPQVTVSIEAPEGVNIRVEINGQTAAVS